MVAATVDTDESVRQAAAGALRKLDAGTPVPRNIAPTHAENDTVLPVSVILSLPELLIQLSAEATILRVDAVAKLGQIGDPRSVEPLITALDDREDTVRQAAIGALGAIGDKRAVPALIRLLKDSSVETRCRAAAAIGETGDLRAVEPLIQALEDRDGDVVGYAAASLGMIGDLRAAEALVIARQGRDTTAVRGAKIGLAYLEDELIFQLRNDPSSQVRLNAVKSLGLIGDPQAVAALSVSMRDDNQRVREEASRALSVLASVNRVGNPGAIGRKAG